MPVELLAHAALVSLRLDSLAETSKTRANTSMHAGMHSWADNKGMGFVTTKLYTSSMPSAAIVRFLAKTLHKRNVSATVTWKERSENTWADDLSKHKYEGWNPANRIRFDLLRFDSISEDVQRHRGCTPLSAVTENILQESPD